MLYVMIRIIIIKCLMIYNALKSKLCKFRGVRRGFFRSLILLFSCFGLVLTRIFGRGLKARKGLWGLD
jgi:hypothetical protein